MELPATGKEDNQVTSGRLQTSSSLESLNVLYRNSSFHMIFLAIN